MARKLKKEVDLDFIGIKVTEMNFTKSGTIALMVER